MNDLSKYKFLGYPKLPSECQSTKDGCCDLPVGTCKQCVMADSPDVLKAKIKELEQDRDEKEVMIKAFASVCELFDQRTWLTQGRGAYKYDDDRYKQEVRYLMDEFNTLRVSTWHNIKTKTFEYRQAIIKEHYADMQTLTLELESTVKDLNKKIMKHMAESAIVILDQKKRIKELEKNSKEGDLKIIIEELHHALKDSNETLKFMNDTAKEYKIPFTAKDQLIKNNDALLHNTKSQWKK